MDFKQSKWIGMKRSANSIELKTQVPENIKGKPNNFKFKNYKMISI